jgi:hypothetical protein
MPPEELEQVELKQVEIGGESASTLEKLRKEIIELDAEYNRLKGNLSLQVRSILNTLADVHGLKLPVDYTDNILSEINVEEAPNVKIG